MAEPARPVAPMPKAGPPPGRRNEVDAILDLFRAIRTRMISGLLLVLPAVITFVILGYLYSTLKAWVLDPTAHLIARLLGMKFTAGLPWWWLNVLSPFIAIVAILTILYFLGYLVRSRLFGVIDWVLLRVPVVTPVYKGVRSAVASLEGDSLSKSLRRVVLVTFPSPGSKALGFVTRSLRDEETGRAILAVSVLNGVVPPAGFTLFVPEEQVTDLDWSVDQALQAILTGGLSAPASIRFFAPGHHGAGPILDTHGEPFRPEVLPGPAIDAGRIPGDG